MQLITNDIKSSNELLKILFSEASLDSFTYSGIYKFDFTLIPNEKFNIEYCSLEVASAFGIFKLTEEKIMSSEINSIMKIWGHSIKSIEILFNMDLEIVFDNSFVCLVSASIEKEDNLIDLSWTIFDSKKSNGFSIWVDPSKEINLRCE